MWSWLSRLFAPPPPVLPQKLWLTAAARDAAVVRSARGAVERGGTAIVVACFRDQLSTTAEAFQTAETTFELWRPAGTLPEIRRELEDRQGQILLTHFDMLPSSVDSSDDPPAFSGRPELTLIATELPVTPKQDQRLQQLADGLAASSFCVHVSLDDAVLQQFVGAGIRDLLRQMGMQEGDAIESPMVTRRVAEARRRIAERVKDNQSADSAEEWLQKNLSAP